MPPLELDVDVACVCSLLREEGHVLSQQAGAAVSARLAAAQEHLNKLRRQRLQTGVEQQVPVSSPAPRSSQIGRGHTAPPGKLHPSSHLGWESVPLTNAIRQARERRRATEKRECALALDWLPDAPPEHKRSSCPKSSRLAGNEQSDKPQCVTLYPDVAASLLREDMCASGRVWLLLRHLDTDGRGWVTASAVRERLTMKSSPLRICGWRQLRNLLAQGDGIFWARDDGPASEGRIWIRSLPKVAATLGIVRLSIRPVALPLSILLESIGSVRAHFYASYHSGRTDQKPIARQTLSDLTGVGRRMQRTYEERAGVKSQENWAVGPEYSKEAAQECAWEHGRAVFQLKDHQGKSGQQGKTYLAWQLPNSYVGPHKPLATTRKKRANRKLVDLFKKGITGNGKKEVSTRGASTESSSMEPRFYERGAAAARAYNRSAQNDLYWQSPVTYSHYRVWHVLPGQSRRPIQRA